MFRWLVLVLLFALPAQFALAAVVGYCAHEKAPASPHIGHHSHQHQMEVERADAPQAQSDHFPGQAHTDCSSCHVHVAQIGFMDCEVFGAVGKPSLVSAPIKLLSSWIYQGIDRPNWARAG